MSTDLRIIPYPDPRLKRSSAPVQKFDDELAKLASRMLELMRAAKGVGLAAPQVGLSIRMFVMNPTQQPGDDRVIVNPVFVNASDEEGAEEGCLSLPGINTEIIRSKTITLRAQDLHGQPIEQTETGYVARVWQHETDHLNGVLIIDRMGPSAKMMFKRTLREMEDEWTQTHPSPARSKVRARR
jgi:peptide deformylase